MARLLCDIYTPDEQPFAGCPRTTLKRQVERAKEARLRHDGRLRGGVLPVREGAGRLADHRSPTIRRPTSTWARWTGARRSGGSSSSSWWRWASRSRRRTTRWPPGQHEIDFKYADALTTADNLDHLQVRRPERRQPLRLHRLVHAQADPGHQRQRHAHPPVAVPGQGQRLLRPQGASTSSPRRR